jgi:hypothetical protein
MGNLSKRLAELEAAHLAAKPDVVDEFIEWQRTGTKG